MTYKLTLESKKYRNCAYLPDCDCKKIGSHDDNKHPAKASRNECRIEHIVQCDRNITRHATCCILLYKRVMVKKC